MTSSAANLASILKGHVVHLLTTLVELAKYSPPTSFMSHYTYWNFGSQVQVSYLHNSQTCSKLRIASNAEPPGLGVAEPKLRVDDALGVRQLQQRLAEAAHRFQVRPALEQFADAGHLILLPQAEEHLLARGLFVPPVADLPRRNAKHAGQEPLHLLRRVGVEASRQMPLADKLLPHALVRLLADRNEVPEVRRVQPVPA